MVQKNQSEAASHKMNRRTALKVTCVGAVSAFATTGVGNFAEAETAKAVELKQTGPAPLPTEFVYEALVTVAAAVEIGPSSRGIRRYIPITGGSFNGPRIKGTVLAGGADWQLERGDGVTEVDALYSIKTEDGAVIIVHNRGLLTKTYVRTVPQFEAPTGAHDWLNKFIFVGSISGAPQPGAVIIRVFRVV